MSEEANQKITIPMPVVAPFGTEVNADAVQMVWDTYIKPGQEAEMPQSIEERILMAILRAIYAGLAA